MRIPIYKDIKLFIKRLNENNRLLKENLYANYFQDSIKDSKWLLNQSFCPSKGAANYSFLFLLFNILDNSNLQNILELGLGQSSKITSQYAKNKNPNVKLTIIDNNKDWIDTFSPKLDLSENTKIELRELTTLPDGSLKYQSENFVKPDEKFDFIVIDAPCGVEQLFPRSNILDLIPDNLSDNFIIILDDFERTGEQNTAKHLFAKLNKLNIKFIKSEISGMKKQLLVTSEHYQFLHWI